MKTSNLESMRGQRGFSLVELLVAAMIMAVGLLGLTTLQAMSIRATGTSAKMQDALRLGEQVLEQVSAEGNQSSLGQINQAFAAAPMKYIGQAEVKDFYQYRTVADPQGEKGTLGPGTSTDYAFLVTITQTETAPAVGDLLLALVTVQIDYIEGVASDGTPITKSITLSREVTHA